MHDIDPLSTVTGERLRALPEQKAEPYGWEEFQRRASRVQRIAAAGTPAATLSLRAAAAMLLMGGTAALAAWILGGPARPTRVSAESGRTPAAVATREPARRSSESLDMRERAAELWLARQPAEPALVRVGAYATVAGLEDRIAQLDDLLTSARAEGMQSANLSPLEDQRARLVSSLAQVRYAETLVAESPP